MTDNLFSQGRITENLVAVSFEPSQQEDNVNGELTFGGTDSSKFTGSINFAYVAAPFAWDAAALTRKRCHPFACACAGCANAFSLLQAAHAHVARVRVLGHQPVDPLWHEHEHPVQHRRHRRHRHHPHPHRHRCVFPAYCAAPRVVLTETARVL